jgi:hypothetical protein
MMKRPQRPWYFLWICIVFTAMSMLMLMSRIVFDVPFYQVPDTQQLSAQISWYAMSMEYLISEQNQNFINYCK